jgi:hypothetical protein
VSWRRARRPFLLAYTFSFPTRAGEGAAAVGMHGASGVNSSHFLVVGGPGAYVGMSSAEVSKTNPVSDSLPLFSSSFDLSLPRPPFPTSLSNSPACHRGRLDMWHDVTVLARAQRSMHTLACLVDASAHMTLRTASAPGEEPCSKYGKGGSWLGRREADGGLHPFCFHRCGRS